MSILAVLTTLIAFLRAQGTQVPCGSGKNTRWAKLRICAFAQECMVWSQLLYDAVCAPLYFGLFPDGVAPYFSKHDLAEKWQFWIPGAMNGNIIRDQLAQLRIVSRSLRHGRSQYGDVTAMETQIADVRQSSTDANRPTGRKQVANQQYIIHIKPR